MTDPPVPVADRLRRIRDRHFDCYVDLANAAKEEGSDDGAVWFEVLDDEVANIRSALEWGLTTARVGTAAFATSLLRYWATSRRSAEGKRFLDRALRQPDIPATDRMDALVAAGWLAWEQGDPAAARDRWEPARALAASEGDVQRQASAAIHLAYALHRLQLAGPAGRAFREALELGDHLTVAERADAMRGLGLISSVEGDHELGRQLHRDARTLLEQAADRTLAVHCAMETNFLLRAGYAEEGLALADEVVALARSGGQPRDLVFALEVKADAARAVGDEELCRQLVEEGISVAAAAGSSQEATFQMDLAVEAVQQGDLVSAA